MRKAAHQGVHIWLARWDENAKIQVLDVHTQRPVSPRKHLVALIESFSNSYSFKPTSTLLHVSFQQIQEANGVVAPPRHPTLSGFCFEEVEDRYQDFPLAAGA